MAVALAAGYNLFAQHPFGWLEADANFQGRLDASHRFLFYRYGQATGHLPAGTNAEHVMRNLDAWRGGPTKRHRTPLWYTVYDADYRIGDGGEMRRRPWAWNSQASGADLHTLPQGVTWLLRSSGTRSRHVVFAVRFGDRVYFKEAWLRPGEDLTKDSGFCAFSINLSALRNGG